MMRGLATLKVCILVYGADRTSYHVHDSASERYPGVYELWPPRRPTSETLDLLRALQPAPPGTACDRACCV